MAHTVVVANEYESGKRVIYLAIQNAQARWNGQIFAWTAIRNDFNYYFSNRFNNGLTQFIEHSLANNYMDGANKKIGYKNIVNPKEYKTKINNTKASKAKEIKPANPKSRVKFQ